MLDCKNAHASNGGDFDKAVEAQRIKGAKDVGTRAERATAEGLVAAKGGALIELNSETDFVAKNAQFQKLAEQVVDAALAAKATDVDALNAAKIGDKTVEETIAELSAKIGEKLVLRRVQYFDGNVETYLHKRAADLPPAVGVLVEFTGSDHAAAHTVALQIAALKAMYLTRDEVPADLVAAETSELNVINLFVPALADADTTRTWVMEAIAESGATSMSMMGKVMGVASKELAGKAEGRAISEMVKTLLAQ
jgi:elongation factor Ts